MITVELLGIDSYLAQDLCKDVHEGLANMYETKAEDILFFAPESFLIYKGLEQTSYRLNIVVEAPNKYLPLEKKVADYLGFDVVPYSGSNARYGFGDVRNDDWLIECKNITPTDGKITIKQLWIEKNRKSFKFSLVATLL